MAAADPRVVLTSCIDEEACGKNALSKGTPPCICLLSKKTRGSSVGTCASGPPLACGRCSSSGSGTTLNGSGSSFQKPFNEAAIAAYQSKNSDVTINYSGGGSGKGKSDLQTKTVTSPAPTAPSSPKTSAAIRAVQSLLPTVAAPITVSYNVNGVEKLWLSPKTSPRSSRRRSPSGTTPRPRRTTRG